MKKISKQLRKLDIDFRKLDEKARIKSNISTVYNFVNGECVSIDHMGLNITL